jgi:hypothetical protein
VANDDAALLRLMPAAQEDVLTAAAGELLTAGRGDPSFKPDIPLSAGPDALVDVSAIALEIFCHSTNFAIRVHQRPPGYLIVDVTDTFEPRPARRTISADGVLLDAGPYTDLMLTLRLGDGPAAVRVPVGILQFTASAWQSYAAGRTNVVTAAPPREQWVRWLVTAHQLWQRDRHLALVGKQARTGGSEGIPSESRVKEAMRQRFSQWPTSNPAEPKRAVIEALHHYGLDPTGLGTWHSGLRALFSQGWPRQSLVTWVDETENETGWAPVGLGGRQGPRDR